eukprot:CAMPEP_0185794986 /NCGR_PEP_ID=MMETSP1174-20130828/160305_1 /TAXON_ID=35687 /ORGANISM="Dictyocha speculum, Strain CCMP1381" /LENGTH=601 /DNA_ID=CAMNT_0028490251 /DNA_START=495 /DNA_END=2301 /DNA_ORIENTATION=-
MTATHSDATAQCSLLGARLCTGPELLIDDPPSKEKTLGDAGSANLMTWTATSCAGCYSDKPPKCVDVFGADIFQVHERRRTASQDTKVSVRCQRKGTAVKSARSCCCADVGRGPLTSIDLATTAAKKPKKDKKHKNRSSDAHYAHGTGSPKDIEKISHRPMPNRPAPLVIFKISRTGSTWLTALLNSLPRSWIIEVGLKVSMEPDEELFGWTKAGASRDTARQRWAVGALKHPFDKQRCYKENKLVRQAAIGLTPQSDPEALKPLDKALYNACLKIQNPNLMLVGFTHNPTKKQSGDEPMDWSAVGQETMRTGPAASVVYMRSNLVKRAVSLATKERVTKKKGEDCVRNGQLIQSKNCTIGAFKIDPRKLHSDACGTASSYRELFASAETIGFPVMQIGYEQMQLDPGAIIHQLFEFMKLPCHSHCNQLAKEVTKAQLEKESVIGRKGEDIHKTGKEDLRGTILNFNVVADYLELDMKDPCLSQMLHSDSIESFTCIPTSCEGLKGLENIQDGFNIEARAVVPWPGWSSLSPQKSGESNGIAGSAPTSFTKLTASDEFFFWFVLVINVICIGICFAEEGYTGDGSMVTIEVWKWGCPVTGH